MNRQLITYKPLQAVQTNPATSYRPLKLDKKRKGGVFVNKILGHWLRRSP